MNQTVQKVARPRGRPRSFDHDAVLDRAVTVFWERGYHATSLDDLTEAMEIGRPSLYAAFGDKRRLFLRALERYGATIGSCGVVALGEERVRDAVGGFLERNLHSATCDGAPGGCMLGSAVGAALGTVEGVDDVVRSLGCTSERMVGDRLSAAVEAGELPDGFPVRERTRLLLDLLHAQSYRARAGETFDALASEIGSKVDAVLR